MIDKSSIHESFDLRKAREDGCSEMIITSIQLEPNNPHRYRLYIDGEFVFSVHEDVVVKHRLVKGKRWEPALLSQVLQEEEAALARMKILRFLSYKPRTNEEVRKYLERHGFTGEAVAHTLQFCQNQGYIDDASYAQMYAEERLERKGYGPYRIAHELKQKGLSTALIRETLSRMGEEEIYRRAMRLATKKMDSFSSAQGSKNRMRIARYLQYRGYPQDLIGAVLEEIFQEKDF